MSEIIPFKKTVPPQDLVLRFMHSAGHKKDAEFYINLFSKTKAESFAIIVLEEEGLRDEFDSILFEIRYLLRLSLYPVVLIRSTSDYMGDLELENYFKKAKLTSNVLSHESTQDEKLEFVEQRIRRRELPVLHLDPQRDIILELTNLANLLRTSKIIFLKRSGGIIDHETQTPIGLINLK
ncbi:MAG TPA: hypothetical protein VJC18_01210, partial [bacterium]|nr:hypothetical protein [bacterium]